MSYLNVHTALSDTDWSQLAQQKHRLLAAMTRLENVGFNCELLEGLLCFIDAIQDAAAAEGYPVVFLSEEPPIDPTTGRPANYRRPDGTWVTIAED